MKIAINSTQHIIDSLETALDFPLFERLHMFEKENIRKDSGVKHNLNHHSTKSKLYIKEKRETKERIINGILSYNFLDRSLKKTDYIDINLI